MTENVQVKPKTLKNVKDAVELLYEITQEEYFGGFIKEKALVRKVATLMIEKGSIIKNGGGRRVSYKWNPVAMKPTKLFIASIAEEISEEKRAQNKRHRDKKKEEKSKPITDMEQINIEREKQEAGVVVDNPSIRQYTIQELWDEIKRQGGYIQDNRLAVTTYFD